MDKIIYCAYGPRFQSYSRKEVEDYILEQVEKGESIAYFEIKKYEVVETEMVKSYEGSKVRIEKLKLKLVE